MDRITMILKKKLIRGVSLTLPWGYIHVYKFSGLRLAFTGPLVLWFEYEFRLIDRFTDEAGNSIKSCELLVSDFENGGFMQNKLIF